MANNAIAIAREQEIFIVEESTRGVLAYPSATDLVIACGFGKISQKPSNSDSNEIRNSRDILDQFADQTPPGTWSFPTYVKPSGVAGGIPQEATLLKCLCGSETINASSVVYQPAMDKTSCSYWLRVSHTVFWARGATVGKADIKLAKTGGAQWDWSGQFMEMGWAGTCALDGDHAASATTVTVKNEGKYTAGSKIEFESDGTVYSDTDGYLITAVDGKDLTISPGLETDLDSGTVVRGYLPAGTETGTALAARKGKAMKGGANVPVQSFDLTFDDQPQYLDEEITSSGFPEDYAETKRTISGNFAIYFREDDLIYFQDGYNNIKDTFGMIIGDTAGSILTISLPKAQTDVPEVSHSDPTVALNTTIKAFGTVGEDSYTIAYT